MGGGGGGRRTEGAVSEVRGEGQALVRSGVAQAGLCHREVLPRKGQQLAVYRRVLGEKRAKSTQEAKIRSRSFVEKRDYLDRES